MAKKHQYLQPWLDYFQVHQDLQPWLDYFQMLHTYEQKGFLQMDAENHEAYVTEPALYTLAGCSFSARELDMGLDELHIKTQVSHLVRRLRIYAASRHAAATAVPEASASAPSAAVPKASASGPSTYDSYPFAVNVVNDASDHAPVFTIVLTTRRPWWKLWMRHDHFDIITYLPPVPPRQRRTAAVPVASAPDQNKTPK